MFANKEEIEEITDWLVKEIALAEYVLHRLNIEERDTLSNGEVDDIREWIKNLRIRLMMIGILTKKVGYWSRLRSMTEFLNPHPHTKLAMNFYRKEREEWLKENGYRINRSFGIEKAK